MNRFIFGNLLGLIALLLPAPNSLAQAQSLRLSLQQAIDYARQNNRTLQAQQLESQRSEQATREARSYLKPSLIGAAQYAYYLSRQTIFLPGSFVGQPEVPVKDVAVGGKNAFNGVLTASQPILAPVYRVGIVTALMMAKLVDEQTADAQSKLTRQVDLAYYAILFLREQVRLQQQSLLRNQRVLADARTLLMQGRALPVDTLRSFVQVQTLRPRINALNSSIRLAQANLKTLLGLPVETTVELSDSLTNQTLTELPTMNLAQAVDQARERRPDIRQQELAVRLSDLQLTKAHADQRPTLTAVGQIQLQSQTDDWRLTRHNWPATSFVGLQLNVPLFAGGRADTRIQSAQVGRRQSELRLMHLGEQVRNELDVRLTTLTDAHANWQIQRQTVQAASGAYQVMNDRFQHGLATRLELTDAELGLTQANTDLLQAVYEVHRARVNLDEALGTYR